MPSPTAVARKANGIGFLPSVSEIRRLCSYYSERLKWTFDTHLLGDFWLLSRLWHCVSAPRLLQAQHTCHQAGSQQNDAKAQHGTPTQHLLQEDDAPEDAKDRHQEGDRQRPGGADVGNQPEVEQVRNRRADNAQRQNRQNHWARWNLLWRCNHRKRHEKERGPQLAARGNRQRTG